MEQPKTFDQACVYLAEEVADLLVKKQQNYGKSNIKEFGKLGVLIRANDKFARLKNLILNRKETVNESKTDSWKDIAGYAILALMLERGWFDLPLEKED